MATNLEPEGWGTRFPLVMRTLFDGEVAPGDAPGVRRELAAIREELRTIPPEAVVWDYEDRSARPPWGEDISDESTDLGNYFVTSDGRDLFEVLDEALADAERRGEPLQVEGGL